MNKSANAVAQPSPAPGLRNVTFSKDWITRPLFGAALALITVAAVLGGAEYLAILAVVVGISAAREWHRMVTSRVYGRDFVITSATIIVTVISELIWPRSAVSWLAIAAGMTLSAGMARSRGERVIWQGAGAAYLCIPIVALLLLRGAPHGAMIIIALFIGVWMTDTGALIVGNLIGGARLWPSLSPNKTWAGTLGGVAAAAAAEAGFVTLLGGHALDGVILGSGIAVIAHCGDLFESWVKRVFQRKDSGSMIPGHGGVLDRIDSTLAAAPCLAVLVLVAGINPLFGTQA
ncbi:MAG TPA: phosphatidate cytidylyltransferase [Rhizomicrobium sp.]|nr:phosphatidate cytidylyltransferase [Rhizomicrobium sp.]